MKKLLTLLLFPIFTFSQISITNTAEIEKIKTGTTFFAMKNPASPKAAAYVEAIKKYWSFNKVEFIKYTDVEKNIAPNNSFVTVTANMTMSKSGSNTETHFYLELWTTNGKFVYEPNKRRHLNPEDKISIATLELFPDYTTQDNPSSVYKMDYDMAGHFKNWGIGVFSNYIQQFTKLLEKAELWSAKVESTKPDELKKLAIDTLYVPDYVLTKFSNRSDDESKKSSEKEVFAKYTQPYKLLTIDELNDKIINSKEAFYYVLFVKTLDARFVTVTNSQTGQNIYSVYSRSDANFKSGDVLDLILK